MKRREFLAQTLASGATLAALAGGLGTLTLPGTAAARTANNDGPRRPNVILLLNDDQGFGDLGCYGHPALKTPHLDRLAAEGCRFTNFYSSSGVCSPSRAGLITGRIQNRFGLSHLINDGSHPQIPMFHHIPMEEPNLARQFKKAGYRTAHIGKWHISFPGRPGEPTPQDYGFDHYLLLAAGRTNSYRDSGWTRNGSRITTQGWSAPVYVDEAIRFIEDGAKGQPFLINLWSFTPHVEQDAAEEFRQMYAGLTEQEQIYYGCISQMDAEYGRLFQYLDEHQLMDNTIIIFSSDNGAEPHTVGHGKYTRGNTGPYRGGKHCIYEAGIHVAGLVRWPGVAEPGSVSHVPVSCLDLLPTLSQAIGAPKPEMPTDGGDFRPALRGEEVQRPHALYWQFEYAGIANLLSGERVDSPPLALREGRWKVLCDLHFTNPQLYNLEADPGEKWNLASVHPEIAERLVKQIETIYADVNGPYSKTAKNLNPQMFKSFAEKHFSPPMGMPVP